MVGIDAIFVNFNDVCCHDAKELVGVIIHLAEFRLRWGKAKEVHCILNMGHDIKTTHGLEFVVNGRDVTVQDIAVGCDDYLAAFFFDCFVN